MTIVNNSLIVTTESKPVEIGWGDVRWMRTVRGDTFPYPPTYEVCTRDGQVYEMAYADYLDLMQSIDDDAQMVRANWMTTNFVEAYMVYDRERDVVPSSIKPAQRRNPITGHFIGGDRGAQ